jgi:hypothetical protein
VEERNIRDYPRCVLFFSFSFSHSHQTAFFGFSPHLVLSVVDIGETRLTAPSIMLIRPPPRSLSPQQVVDIRTTLAHARSRPRVVLDDNVTDLEPHPTPLCPYIISKVDIHPDTHHKHHHQLHGLGIQIDGTIHSRDILWPG